MRSTCFSVEREVPFDKFWRKRCENDWKLALRTFSFGVPLFMMVVALVAWIVFWEHDCLYYAASIVTAISGSMAVLWFTSTERKWGDFLTSTDARITARFDNIETPKSERSPNSIPKEAVNGSFQQNTTQNNNDDASSGSQISLDLSSFAIGELSQSEQKLKTKPFPRSRNTR